MLKLMFLSKQKLDRSHLNFQLKFVMPSHPHYLPVVRAAVHELCGIYGLPEDSCHGVTLAVDEALANIIRHAYKNHYDQKVDFTCEVDAEHIEFRILDWGEPPDPGRICGQPLDEVSLSGRGTHLMRAIMDDVCYLRVADANQVRLTKRLPAKVNVEGE